MDETQETAPEDDAASVEPAAAGAREPEQRGLELLEFSKVRAMLANRTRFFLSRDLALAARPLWTRDEVDRLQAETAEARVLLGTAGDIGLGGIEDVRPLLQRASLGGMLSGAELRAASRPLEATHEARQVVRSMGRQTPLLSEVAAPIADLRSLARRIDDAITDRGAVRDSAASGLAELRARVATGYNRLVSNLEKTTGSADVRPALQSPAIATRGDRLVLEVKIEQRNAVPGIVHDVSNTGATLFIEPFAAVELCNQWRETSAETKRAEDRVLRRLSAALGELHDEAIASLEAAADLDLIVARARLAAAMDAAPVEALEPGSDTPVELVDARHPLLGDGAVPATVSIGPGFRGLVITGPNAGGKTVCLKTVGLLALMHQAGLQLPAAGDSRLAVFDCVFADIGDEQSIERSISTFSSHLGAVAEILERATPHSLVLLDELGTGTDPEEGSALARAVMAEFVRRDVPVVATTHHRSVAEYAGDADGVENASMELDPDTHLPTYHLVMGVPGRSYALAIARHLGLPESVVEQAEALVGSEHRDAERLLSQLQQERKKLAGVASEAERERSGAERLRRELEDRLADVGRRQDEMIDETQRELRREAEEMRRELRRIERDARLAGHHAAARRAAEGARRQLRDPDWFNRGRRDREIGDGKKADESTADLPAAEAPVESLAPGDVVELKGLGARAEVQSVDADGTVQLLIGGATARLDMAEVRRLEGVKIATPEPERYTVDAGTPGESASDEIDLRGMRAHEVEPALAAFLDRCALNGVDRARVVHGRGTGAVREAVREVLARSPAAAGFHPADSDHGGDAVTVVELA